MTDEDLTASEHGSSPIGFADVVEFDGHAPTPWRLDSGDGTLVLDAKGHEVCSTWERGNHTTAKAAYANASLIVAAVNASLHREAIAEKPCFEGVNT